MGGMMLGIGTMGRMFYLLMDAPLAFNWTFLLPIMVIAAACVFTTFDDTAWYSSKA